MQRGIYGHILNHRSTGGGVANIYRLILLLLLSFWSVSSFAAISQTTQVQTACPYTGGGVSGKYESVDSLCSSGWANSCAKAWDPSASTRMQSSGMYAGRCVWFLPTGAGDVIGGSFVISNVLACPSNSTLVGGSCECNEGFEENGSQCKPVNPCPEGMHEEFNVCVPDDCKPDEVRQNGLCVKEPPCPEGQDRVNGECKPSKCDKGKSYGTVLLSGEDSVVISCEFDYEGGRYCMARAIATFDMTYNGKTEYSGVLKGVGSSCTPGTGDGGGSGSGDGGGDTGDGDGGGNDGDGDGGGGTGNPGGGGGGGGGDSNGGGNGNNDGGGACPGGGGSEPDRLPGVEPPTGTAPDEGSGGCPPGSVLRNGLCYSSEPKPPDEDGKCPSGTVKVNTQCIPLVPKEPPSGDGDGDGDGSGGGGSTGGLGGNGDKSNFGGSCMAGFVCEGDAVQCAIAREIHRRNCVLFNDESDESKLYNDNKGKEGNQTGELPGNESVDIGGRIDTSDALGGGACVADLNISVMGQSITLPFSQLCPYLAMLGNLLVAVSMLLAARIIMRG